jgi:hypothetical protein
MKIPFTGSTFTGENCGNLPFFFSLLAKAIPSATPNCGQDAKSFQ